MTTLQKKLLALAIGIMIILAGGGFWLWNSSGTTNQTTYTITTNSGTVQTETVTSLNGVIGYLSEVSGIVKVERGGTSTAGILNMRLESDMTLITEAKSVATLILADSSIVRLSENSRLVLTSQNELGLESGSVWARIVKPITDNSLFTIKTSDSSAGVRGTAVEIKKTSSGTVITVIDSTSKKDAVSVQYTQSGSLKEDTLNPEESINVESDKVEKKTIVLSKFLTDNREATENLKRDLLYLNDLKKKLNQEGNNDHGTRVENEIRESLPKSDEVEKFFESKATGDVAKEILNGTGTGTTQKEKEAFIFEIIRGDMELVQKKRDLERLRDTTPTTQEPNSAENLKKEINTLETDIRDFDARWKKDFEARRKQILEDAKKEELALQANSGTGTATGTGVNTYEDDTTGTGVTAPLPKPAPAPMPAPAPAPMPTPAPMPAPAPKPVVSGTALPK